MRRNPNTIHLSPKAYPFDWQRFGLVILGGVVLVLVLYAKFVA